MRSCKINNWKRSFLAREFSTCFNNRQIWDNLDIKQRGQKEHTVVVWLIIMRPAPMKLNKRIRLIHNSMKEKKQQQTFFEEEKQNPALE